MHLLLLSLSAGVATRQERDLLHSPLRYGAPTMRLSAGLQGGTTWMWSAQVRVEPGLWSPQVGARSFTVGRYDPATGTEEAATFPHPSGGLGWGMRLAVQRPVGPWRVGLALDERGQDRTVAMSRAPRHQVDALLTLGWSDAGWSAQVGLPLGSVQTRLPYGLDPQGQDLGPVAGFFREGTALVSWGAFQAVEVQAAWQPARWGVGGWAQWEHRAVPVDLYALEAGLEARCSF